MAGATLLALKAKLRIQLQPASLTFAASRPASRGPIRSLDISSGFAIASAVKPG